MPIRFCEYGLNDDLTPSITSYNYEDAIQVRWTTKEPPQYLSITMDAKPIMVIKGASATYSEGAFSLSGVFRHCVNREMGVVGGAYNWYGDAKIKCTLRIGSYWYDGEKWTDNSWASFFMEFKKSEGKTTWFSIKDTKTLEMPYSGLNGRIIPINEAISGELELTIFASYVYASGAITNLHEYGYFLKDLKFLYQKEDFNGGKGNDNSDRYYENIVNEDYINELDEIEFKISSYNNDGACYSKVLLDDNYLTNNLYSAVMDKQIRPEEQLIHRIVNRYNATNIKLTQVIRESQDLTPITRLSDKYMRDKVFINAGGIIDYSMDSFQCTMIQI